MSFRNRKKNQTEIKQYKFHRNYLKMQLVNQELLTVWNFCMKIHQNKYRSNLPYIQHFPKLNPDGYPKLIMNPFSVTIMFDIVSVLISGQYINVQV